MSWDYYHTSTPIAKKDYDCDAWPWIDNGDVINQGILSVSDYREIIKAERFRDGYLKGLSELVTMLQHCNLDADKPSDEVEQ